MAHRRRRLAHVVRILRERYPTVSVPLRHETPWQLLVATILSAQCTDAKVNQVTPELFRRFPGPAEMAGASLAEIEELIRPTGFFRAKARALQGAARQILLEYGGELPRRLEELVKLPGVGRKTANVILSAAELEKWPGWEPRAAGGLGVVVDTHVARIAQRLGLTLARDPARIEQDLLALLPEGERATFPLRLIYFGRQVCTSRKPRCPSCPLFVMCPAGKHQGTLAWLTPRAR
ncbi:MAG TPA: endonuclease III [Firmicutes bacterium]|nr:endonuclease III [Bacillota bacterium]